MNNVLLGFLLFGLLACTSSQDRKITSISNVELLHNLLDDVDKMSSIQYDSYRHCSITAENLYKRFYILSPKDFQLRSISDQNIIDLTKKSFDLRLKIKEATKKISNLYPDQAKCLNSVIAVSRALRYFEDYLIESRNFKENEFITFKSDGVYFQRNELYKFDSIKDLKSGDVILSRGNAYSSASIARIGNADAQFSHLSFVYIDEDKKIYTTEAHIEVGSFVSPITQNINQKNARSVVLRFQDSKLAHQASKMIFEKVKKKMLQGKNIPYDFKMKHKDHSDLFCSEIISYGFELASSGSLDVPYHKTYLQPGIESFLSMLGINNTKESPIITFAPADILFDPRFDIIAEWRDPSKIKDAREKDAIITKMFDWMAQESYVLKPKLLNKITSYTAWTLRRIPWIKNNFKKKFPLNMTTKGLQLFLVLDKVAENIHTELQKDSNKEDDELGFQELFQTLEEIKHKDLELYNSKIKRRKRFHKFFNKN